MRIDLANDIKIGDIVYNCFMDEIVVTSISKDFTINEKPKRVFFGTIDTRLYKASYDSNDVYHKDLSDESDEEKSWITWATNNREIVESLDDLELGKKMYKIGFANGFKYKHEISIEEMLQK